MAAIDFTRSALAPRGGFSAITAIFGSVLNWNDARQTRVALSKLTDRELDDIGLCRGDIDDVADGNLHR